MFTCTRLDNEQFASCSIITWLSTHTEGFFKEKKHSDSWNEATVGRQATIVSHRIEFAIKLCTIKRFTYPYKAPAPNKKFLLSEEKGMKMFLAFGLFSRLRLNWSIQVYFWQNLLPKTKEEKRKTKRKKDVESLLSRTNECVSALSDPNEWMLCKVNNWLSRVSMNKKKRYISLYSRSATSSLMEGCKLSDFPFVLPIRIYRCFVHQHSCVASESNDCESECYVVFI